MAADIPFDVSYDLPDGLRAVPCDPVAMAHAVDWLEEQAAASHQLPDQARLLGLAGGYAGMLRQLDRAGGLLRRAITIADDAGATRQGLVLRIRLADVVALAGDPDAAIQALEAALAACQADAVLADLIDVACQHLGKALLEAGRHDQAIARVERALELRQRKADPALVASTQATLRTARLLRADT